MPRAVSAASSIAASSSASGCSPVLALAVVAREIFLEIVVPASDRAHFVRGDRLDQRVGGALERDHETHSFEDDILDARHGGDSVDLGKGARELDLQTLDGDPA